MKLGGCTEQRKRSLQTFNHFEQEVTNNSYWVWMNQSLWDLRFVDWIGSCLSRPLISLPILIMNAKSTANKAFSRMVHACSFRIKGKTAFSQVCAIFSAQEPTSRICHWFLLQNTRVPFAANTIHCWRLMQYLKKYSYGEFTELVTEEHLWFNYFQRFLNSEGEGASKKSDDSRMQISRALSDS